MNNPVKKWRQRTVTTEEEPDLVENQEDLAYLINEAYDELLAVRSYFNEISDPLLVDHAIFLVQAAEKRYNFLLSNAKKLK